MNEFIRKNTDIDWSCILRDILRQWWIIVLSGAGAFLMTAAVMQFAYRPAYTSESAFVIGLSGLNAHSISENLSQAETTCRQYTQVVESSILKKQVCEDLSLDTFEAKVTVATVPSSNLMVLSVTAASPRQAYLISRSIIKHAVKLMAYFLDDVSMQELQQSQIPTAPSNPVNFFLWGERAGLVSMAGMMLILGLMSLVRDTVRRPEDVSSKVDARLLGTICYEKKRQSLLLTSPVLSFDYVETSHMLSARICMTLDRLDKQVLMVTSTAENEGKSTIAANLAVSMAQSGKKVLLCDCDFRKPSQYKIFSSEYPESPDFTEAIENQTPVDPEKLKRIPGLSILFPQKPMARPWNKTELQFVRQTLLRLKSSEDYVILDTSPAALISDTEEYASLADAALMVIHQNEIEACCINDTIDALNDAGTHVIGCVLNALHHPILKNSGYSKYYSRYRHNGYAYSRKAAPSRKKGHLPNE